MSSNYELAIKLELLKEIRSKMFGHCIGDIGFTAIFTEYQLGNMKKDIEKQLTPCQLCELNNQPHCGNPWCCTRNSKDEGKKKPKQKNCGNAGNGCCK